MNRHPSYLLLLAPLLLAGCGKARFLGIESPPGAQPEKQFTISFSTRDKLEKILPVDGNAAADWRLGCDLNDNGFLAIPEPDRSFYFYAPISPAPRDEKAHGDRFVYSATGHIKVLGDGSSVRSVANDELAAQLAKNTSIPCNIYLKTAGKDAVAAAGFDISTEDVLASLR